MTIKSSQTLVQDALKQVKTGVLDNIDIHKKKKETLAFLFVISVLLRKFSKTQYPPVHPRHLFHCRTQLQDMHILI